MAWKRYVKLLNTEGKVECHITPEDARLMILGGKAVQISVKPYIIQRFERVMRPSAATITFRQLEAAAGASFPCASKAERYQAKRLQIWPAVHDTKAVLGI